MKQSKVPLLVKNLSVQIKRELKEGNFHVTTTVLLCLSLTTSVLILGVFLNNNVKKYLASTEDTYYTYFPQFTTTFESNQPRSLEDNNPAPNEVLHSMSDQELMLRASSMSHVEYYNRLPKLAFMFLTRGRLPLAPLWEMFFKGHEGFYSIYVHNSTEFSLEPPQSSVFYNRRIPSKVAEWGKATMIDAERRLLANALLDLSNKRFILLSETCIPIFNFTTIYHYLMNSNRSFLGSFDDPRKIGRGRYRKRMFPTVTLSDWRKGSQWFEVERKVAVRMVSDFKYYDVFKEHCKPPCYMDEHYFPTLVTKICAELNTNWSITWADWSLGGSHPTAFVRRDVSKAFLRRIRNDFSCNIYYNLGSRKICYLFARKFHASTLEPLLTIAPSLLGFKI